MDVEEYKRIINDQREEAEDLIKHQNIIEREVNMRQLQGFLKFPNVLVISGVRRSGKSILALNIFRGKKHGYINFDDERLAGFTSKDFNSLLEGFYELYGTDLDSFIFDEIQNIPSWELFINRLRRTKKVILTGSNANLLSSELATHLTGRYIDFNLYPFSFKEYLKLKKVTLKEEDQYSTKAVSQIKRLLKEYIELGGFPEVYKFGRRMVEKIYDDIINKDILMRHKIKNRITFKELARYLISNFSGETGYAKLKNIFSIKNVHTAKDYAGHLVSTFLVFIMEKFSYKLKQQLIASKKIYAIDTGLINFLAFQFSENYGKLIENIVFLELMRRKSYINNTNEVYFWKNYSGKEVDFIIMANKKVKELIQVSFTLSNPGTKKREINSLIKASSDLRCNNLKIITWETTGKEKINGKTIDILPLWEWLIKGNYSGIESKTCE